MPGPKQQPRITPDDLPRPDDRPERAGIDWSTMADDADDVSPEELETVDELTDFDDEADEVGDEDDDNPYQESDEALPDDDEEAALGTFNRREAGDSY